MEDPAVQGKNSFNFKFCRCFTSVISITSSLRVEKKSEDKTLPTESDQYRYYFVRALSLKNMEILMQNIKQ